MGARRSASSTVSCCPRWLPAEMTLTPTEMNKTWLSDGFAGAEEGVRFRYPRQLANVLTASAGLRPLDIIDVGSAVGTIGIWLGGRDRRFRVVGVDHRPELVGEAIDRARVAGAAARFVVANAAERLPAMDESLDGVVVHRLRDSLVDRAQRSALTAELRRVLRPGGLVSLLEDMRVQPRERHGPWYARRYRVHRRVVELLMGEARIGLAQYATWLADPDAELLMSLRAQDGTKVDDVAYEGCEEELARAISDGRIWLRGVGIHQSVRRVRADFADCGFVVHKSWRSELAEPPPRIGHAAVMKGLLLQRDDRPET